LVWASFKDNGVEVVFVLTESQEYLVRARRALPAFYRAEGLEAIHLPIPDFQAPPDLIALNKGLELAEERLLAGKNIAVHCMAGIGRTGIFFACLARRVFRMDGETAIAWIRQSIPEAMENSSQENFVNNFLIH